MRKFTVECKDTKTGLSMVLSECSYNMACDWLHRTLEEYGVEVFCCETGKYKNIPVTIIHTGVPNRGIDYTGMPNMFYTLCRRYFYDEERGYLLGE